MASPGFGGSSETPEPMASPQPNRALLRTVVPFGAVAWRAAPKVRPVLSPMTTSIRGRTREEDGGGWYRWTATAAMAGVPKPPTLDRRGEGSHCQEAGPERAPEGAHGSFAHEWERCARCSSPSSAIFGRTADCNHTPTGTSDMNAIGPADRHSVDDRLVHAVRVEQPVQVDHGDALGPGRRLDDQPVEGSHSGWVVFRERRSVGRLVGRVDVGEREEHHLGAGRGNDAGRLLVLGDEMTVPSRISHLAPTGPRRDGRSPPTARGARRPRWDAIC